MRCTVAALAALVTYVTVPRPTGAQVPDSAPAAAPVVDTVATDSIADAAEPAVQRRLTSYFTIASGGGYNRVEGLPVLLGPVLQTRLGTSVLRLSAFGIVRSAETFRLDGDNLGHDVRLTASFDAPRPVTIAARLYDVVDAVEEWQIPRDEAGLAAFFFRSDFLDHFGRHGASVTATLPASKSATITGSLARERWHSRQVRDVLTVFRNGKAWRPNPAVDEGLFRVGTAAVVYDTRNDSRRPSTGWLVSSTYELGSGRIASFGAISPAARSTNEAETTYGRLFVDARRYFRLTPISQLNGRVVLGGWVHGDELPIQRRLSVGGIGTVPGIDFREEPSGADVAQCSTAPAPAGDPAQCERALLLQVEYRVGLRSKPGSIIGRTVRIRSRAFTVRPSLVVFADAGRGWLVDAHDGGEARDLVYSSAAIPPLSTFRSDIGVGVDLGLFGIYAAKSISERGEPINIFLRARRRF